MGEYEDKAATINAIPAPTNDTGSVKLASTAEGAMTTKPEALESCAGGMAGYGPLSATKECGRGQGCNTGPPDNTTLREQHRQGKRTRLRYGFGTATA